MSDENYRFPPPPPLRPPGVRRPPTQSLPVSVTPPPTPSQQSYGGSGGGGYGAVPMAVYSEHTSGAMTVQTYGLPQPPPQPPHHDDLSLFAKWWKMIVGIAAGTATVGAVIWAIGTLLFVSSRQYETDKNPRDQLQQQMKNTLDQVQTTMKIQTIAFENMSEQLHRLQTELSVMKAVEDERRGVRRRNQ